MRMKQPLISVTNLRRPTKSEDISMRKLVTASAFMLLTIGAAPAVQRKWDRVSSNPVALVTAPEGNDSD